VPNFSSVALSLNELKKKDVTFQCGAKQKKVFQRTKLFLTIAPILALPDFSKPFELECHASRVGIGVVLLQSDQPIAYFSEKLHGATLN